MTIGISAGELRRRNRDLVLREIVSETSVSRSRIARKTGLTGAAVSRITRQLVDAGLVRENGCIRTKGRVGRSDVRLELGDGGAYVLAIALTANVKSVSIGDSRGEIVARRALEGLDGADPDRTIAEIRRQTDRLIARSGIDVARLVGCGVSVAGVTYRETGTLIESDPLGWTDVPLGSVFSDAFDLPVRVERRPVALLTAEMWRGAARGLRDVALINNGLWIGGCLVADGRVLTGTRNRIGQTAHLAVAGRTDPCVCGRKGCLDAVASGGSIVEALRDVRIPGSDGDEEPGERLRSLARHRGSDLPQVADAFRRAGRCMGHAVDHLFAAFDPELVLLAGETSRNPHYLDGVLETLSELRPRGDAPPVKVSDMTSDLSAVWIGLEAFVFSRALDIEKLIAA